MQKKLSDEVVAAMGFSRSYPFTTFHDAVYVHCSDTLPHKPCQVGGFIICDCCVACAQLHMLVPLSTVVSSIRLYILSISIDIAHEFLQ